jgi:uncharacterized protein (DUF2461 family)
VLFFRREALNFLCNLAKFNDGDWLTLHKAEFEAILKQPMLGDEG